MLQFSIKDLLLFIDNELRNQTKQLDLIGFENSPGSLIYLSDHYQLFNNYLKIKNKFSPKQQQQIDSKYLNLFAVELNMFFSNSTTPIVDK